MEEQTYDPVLSEDDVPKWRLVNPLRPPAPGRALVLVRESGPSLTIRSGEEIRSSRFGAYRSVFTVDMTEHRLILDIPLLSRDATFSFRSRVDLVCRVADPAEVVSRGIRDMSGALYGYLRKTLRSVARDYDIAEFHEAEMALNAALAGFSGDDAIRLSNIQVELLVDEDEISASGREFRDVVRETRLDRMRRRRHLDMIREEGVDGLIAEIMEKEGPRAALAWIEKGEAEKREVRREVMRMVLERGDADREPFEQAELERAVLDEVLRDGDGLFETATRHGRLRGSLTRALEPGPEARDDDVDRGGRGGGASRSRARCSESRTATPSGVAGARGPSATRAAHRARVCRAAAAVARVPLLPPVHPRTNRCRPTPADAPGTGRAARTGRRRAGARHGPGGSGAPPGPGRRKAQRGPRASADGTRTTAPGKAPEATAGSAGRTKTAPPRKTARATAGSVARTNTAAPRKTPRAAAPSAARTKTAEPRTAVATAAPVATAAVRIPPPRG